MLNILTHNWPPAYGDRAQIRPGTHTNDGLVGGLIGHITATRDLPGGPAVRINDTWVLAEDTTPLPRIEHA